MKSECEYCKMENGCGKIIDNMKDDFNIQHELFEKDWYLSAATNNVFLLVKIKYCPMCGRKLKGKKKK